EGGVLVAEREGLAVGVVQVAPEQLDGLFVLPWAWGSGVADRLHDAAVQRLRRGGGGWGQLLVLGENPRARVCFWGGGGGGGGGGRPPPPPPPPPADGRLHHHAGHSLGERGRRLSR